MAVQFSDEISPRFKVSRVCEIFGVERAPPVADGLAMLAFFSIPANHWPLVEYEGLIEGANADGERYLEYWRKFRDHPDFPVSPWDAERGYARLPELPAKQAEKLPAPSWHVLEAVATLAGVVAPGGTITALPARPNLPALEPLNVTARLISQYVGRHGITGWIPSELWKNGRPNLPWPSPETIAYRGGV